MKITSTQLGPYSKQREGGGGGAGAGRGDISIGLSPYRR